MSINLEQVDELRKRANVSYEDARDALEKFEGNMVDALIYLEKSKRIKSSEHYHYHQHQHHHGQVFDKVKGFWKRGNKIRFIVLRHDKTILNLPLPISIIIVALTFKYSIAALIVALILGCRFKFKDGLEDMKVNETLNKMHDNIDVLKSKLSQEA